MKRITPGSRKQHRISETERKLARAMVSLAVVTSERNRYATRCVLYDKDMLRTADILGREQGLIEQLQATVARQHADILRLRNELAESEEVNANQAALITEAVNQLTATAVELLEAEKRIREYEEGLREARQLFDLGKHGRVVLYPPLRAEDHAQEAV